MLSKHFEWLVNNYICGNGVLGGIHVWNVLQLYFSGLCAAWQVLSQCDISTVFIFHLPHFCTSLVDAYGTESGQNRSVLTVRSYPSISCFNGEEERKKILELLQNSNTLGTWWMVIECLSLSSKLCLPDHRLFIIQSLCTYSFTDWVIACCIFTWPIIVYGNLDKCVWRIENSRPFVLST